ncbi:MAG TPA: cation:proton antiporter [Acidimicrobiia bacterium]|nr:cation:proton antiporter [Acidimicrobiia bacterium]
MGHLFIPVFFLQIGIDVDVSSFGQLTVLRDAAILLVVAVAGKLVAAVGTAGTPSDKLLVGLGMLPRGEVGLIFATIGLGAGVLDDDLYAALLLVVLATTLVTPVLLRRRYDHLAARARAADPNQVGTRSMPPPGGWIQVLDGEIALSGRPDPACAAEVALEAARYVARARPSATLLDWFSANQGAALPWSPRATKSFIDLLRTGNARSWRFLDALDVLPRALPELAEPLRGRRTNPFELDPLRLHRWETLELLAQFRATDEGAAEWNALVLPERVLVAAFLIDVVGDRDDALAATHRFVSRLDLGNAAEHEISTVVHEPELMLDLARARDGLHEDAVLRLAVHLRSPETARAAYVVAAVRAGPEVLHRSHLRELHELVQRAFADPLVGLEAENLVARHRADAAQLVVRPGALTRIEDAPREYVLSHAPDELARHAELVSSWDEQKAKHALIAVATCDTGEHRWWIDVVAGNRQGLLARVAGLLSTMGYDVERAVAVTWPSGPALESFLVTGATAPDDARLRDALATAVHAPLRTEPVADAEVVFDDTASPWYTICEVRAPDTPGLLGAIAAALADAGVDVHGADVSSDGSRAFDRFEVTAGTARLTHATRAAVRHNLATGVELTGHRSLRQRIVSQGMATLRSVTRQIPVSDATSQPH